MIFAVFVKLCKILVFHSNFIFDLNFLFRKRRGNEYVDSDSTSSFDDNFSVSKGRIKNLHKLGIKNINSGFPEGIKEENEENTTKTKISGNKLTNFSALHKKRTEVEKDKTTEHLKPNLYRQKIRKTLSDPSTIEQHAQTSSASKSKNGKKVMTRRNKKNNMVSLKVNNFETAKKSSPGKSNFNMSK
jgi:hypothetical protein